VLLSRIGLASLSVERRRPRDDGATLRGVAQLAYLGWATAAALVAVLGVWAASHATFWTL
jgi:hypothetical protein